MDEYTHTHARIGTCSCSFGACVRGEIVFSIKILIKMNECMHEHTGIGTRMHATLFFFLHRDA
jgi:hypothetical protein